MIPLLAEDDADEDVEEVMVVVRSCFPAIGMDVEDGKVGAVEVGKGF